MTDPGEHTDPEHAQSRPLTSDEERFFGEGQHDHHDPHDPHRAGEEHVRPRRGDAAYEAGAAAEAEAERLHRDPDAAPVDQHGHPADRPRHEEPPPESAPDPRAADPARDPDLDRHSPLFPADEADSLRTRWDGIQTEFVDEPRAAVEKADALVGDVMQRLADGFSSERSRLERHWDRGDGVSTEDLRVALKRYRSFFDRLLSI